MVLEWAGPAPAVPGGRGRKSAQLHRDPASLGVMLLLPVPRVGPALQPTHSLLFPSPPPAYRCCHRHFLTFLPLLPLLPSSLALSNFALSGGGRWGIATGVARSKASAKQRLVGGGGGLVEPVKPCCCCHWVLSWAPPGSCWHLVSLDRQPGTNNNFIHF